MRCCEAWKPIEDSFDTLSSSVLISSDLARFLLALLVKTLRLVKLRSQPSLGRKQKKTLLWLDAEVDNVPGAKKPVLTLSAVTDEEDHTLENEDDFGRRLVSIGEPSSKLDRKVRDISNMKIFCDMFNKLLMK